MIILIILVYIGNNDMKFIIPIDLLFTNFYF